MKQGSAHFAESSDNKQNGIAMRKLTKKENFIMNLFWDHGKMFIRDLISHYDEPKPHFNTVSTQVRTLEKDGFVSYDQVSGNHLYYPLVTREQYGDGSLNGVVASYFKNSYLDVVSNLVRDEKISLDELKSLIEKIEKGSAE